MGLVSVSVGKPRNIVFRLIRECDDRMFLSRNEDRQHEYGPLSLEEAMIYRTERGFVAASSVEVYGTHRIPLEALARRFCVKTSKNDITIKNGVPNFEMALARSYVRDRCRITLVSTSPLLSTGTYLCDFRQRLMVFADAHGTLINGALDISKYVFLPESIRIRWDAGTLKQPGDIE